MADKREKIQIGTFKIADKKYYLCLQVNALKEYYEEHDGGGQQMLRFQSNKPVHSLLKSLNLRITNVYIFNKKFLSPSPALQ